MSVACQKRYTLTVNAAPSLSAYWTFEESGFVDRVDKVKSIHMTDVTGNGITNTPGLFGNGMGFFETASANNLFNTGPTTALAFSGSGFSYFFWMKVLLWDAVNYAFGPLVSTAGQFFNGANLWEMLAFLDSPSKHLKFQYDDASLNNITLPDYVVTLGQWFFVHIFYDPVSSTWGYSINNGSPLTANLPCGSLFVCPLSAAFGFAGLRQVWTGGNTGTLAAVVDELGIKLDRMLNASELGYLYNGGVGRTWPFT